MKSKEFTLRITFTSEELCSFFNERFGHDNEFTEADIVRNWEGIRAWIENTRDQGILSEVMWEDFDSCAEDWDIDLFN